MEEQASDNGQPSAVRLRVRLASALASKNTEEPFRVGDRDAVVISPHDAPLEDNPWTIFKVRDFSTKDAAEAFGIKLVRSLQVVSVKHRLGIDTGENRATSIFGQIVAGWYAERGLEMHPNIHGLYVHPDKPNLAFPSISATAKTKISHDIFLSAVADAFNNIQDPNHITSLNSVLLFNDALLQTDEVGRLALSIAAVEALGHKEIWSASQVQALKRLVDAAEQDQELSPPEREEIAGAVRRSYKIGVMESIRRVLTRLNLEVLKKPWEN